MQDPAWLIRKSDETPVWREVDGITVFGAYTLNEQNTLTLRTPYGIKEHAARRQHAPVAE
jgi:hypothetical protein